MNTKKDLEEKIEELQGNIAKCNQMKDIVKINVENLTPKEVEERYKYLDKLIAIDQEELNTCQEKAYLYDELKTKIEKLHELQNKQNKDGDDLRLIEILNKEIKDGKLELGQDLAYALEQETRVETPQNNNHQQETDEQSDTEERTHNDTTQEENQENIDEEQQSEDSNTEHEQSPEESEQQEEAQQSENTSEPAYDAHVSSYEALINDEIKKLNKKISKLQNKNPHFVGKETRINAKIEYLKNQIQMLENVKNEVHANGFDTNNILIEVSDERINKRNDKINDKQEEIEELQRLKSQVKGKFTNRILDKKIRKRNEKIKDLQRANVKIAKRQKKYLVPKLYAQLLREKGNSKVNGKITAYESTIADMQALQTEAKGIFGEIRKTHYANIEEKYQRKLEHQREILESLNRNSGAIRLTGGTERSLPRNVVESLTENIQRENVDQNQVSLAA